MAVNKEVMKSVPSAKLVVLTKIIRGLPEETTLDEIMVKFAKE